MNEENLKPLGDERTKSEQREIQSSGGIASGVARRRKKSIAEIYEAMWGVTTKVQIRQLKKKLEEERAASNPNPEMIQLLEDQLDLLQEGGAVALMTMQAITDKRANPATKLMGIEMTNAYEHGKPKQINELTGLDGAPLVAPTLKNDV